MSFDEIMNLAAKFTVARMLERDDFSKRYSNQQPISVHEFFYPLMQGYDSVMINADVELGATDQKFNLVTGRKIQEEYGQPPQIIITMPVLEGLDGKQRMSKSLGNYIGIDEKPKEMYGKVMSIPDNLIISYFTLVSDVSLSELKTLNEQLNDNNTNPRDIKKHLGRTIVKMYHGENASIEADKHFEKVFAKKEIPDEMPEFQFDLESVRIDELLIQSKTASTKSEARRLIKQGGVSVNGNKITDAFFDVNIVEEIVLKVGKRKFARIRKK